jgi:beta-galactosidase
MPVIQNFNIAPGIKLDWAPARIYTIVPQGETTTVVTYGDLHTPVQLYFSTDSAIKIIKGSPNFTGKTTKLAFSAIVRAPATEHIFTAGGHQVRILVIQRALAGKTWVEEIGQDKYLITGPSYITGASLEEGKIRVSTERQWNDKNPMPAVVYTEKGSSPLSATVFNTPLSTLIVKPSGWQMKPAAEAASPEFNDSGWKQSDQPLQMGADGDITANAWYRTKVQVDTSGTYIMRFKNLKERAALFVNGAKQDAELTDKSFTFDLQAGRINTLSIFTAHNGRNKLLFFLGGLDTVDVKGITGPVTLERDSSNVRVISGWKMKGGPGDPFALEGWTGLPAENFAGPAFFRSTFTMPRADKSQTVIWRVNITSMGHGSVWVNGHNLGRYPEKIKVFGLYIPEPWLKEGENTIVIYDEDGTNPGKVVIEAEKEASRDNLLLAEY